MVNYDHCILINDTYAHYPPSLKFKHNAIFKHNIDIYFNKSMRLILMDFGLRRGKDTPSNIFDGFRGGTPMAVEGEMRRTSCHLRFVYTSSLPQ